MRRLIPFVIVAAVIASSFLVAEADIDTGSCSASQAVAVDGVTSPSPICSFDLSCGTFRSCLYTVRLNVNGTGQVSGSMSAHPLFLFDQASWTEAGVTPASPPSCRGLFSCRSGTGTVQRSCGTSCTVTFLSPVLQVTGNATVTCSGGGLAALETISCSAKAISQTAP